MSKSFKSFIVKKGLVPLEFFNKQKKKFNGAGAAMWRKFAFGEASRAGFRMVNVWISKMAKPYEQLRRRSKQFPWGNGNKS